MVHLYRIVSVCLTAEGIMHDLMQFRTVSLIYAPAEEPVRELTQNMACISQIYIILIKYCLFMVNFTC